VAPASSLRFCGGGARAPLAGGRAECLPIYFPRINARREPGIRMLTYATSMFKVGPVYGKSTLGQPFRFFPGEVVSREVGVPTRPRADVHRLGEARHGDARDLLEGDLKARPRLRFVSWHRARQ
jgi:hypothetical protein